MREMRIFLEHLESAQWAENWETDAGKKNLSLVQKFTMNIFCKKKCFD